MLKKIIITLLFIAINATSLVYALDVKDNEIHRYDWSVETDYIIEYYPTRKANIKENSGDLYVTWWDIENIPGSKEWYFTYYLGFGPMGEITKQIKLDKKFKSQVPIDFGVWQDEIYVIVTEVIGERNLRLHLYKYSLEGDLLATKVMDERQFYDIRDLKVEINNGKIYLAISAYDKDRNVIGDLEIRDLDGDIIDLKTFYNYEVSNVRTLPYLDLTIGDKGNIGIAFKVEENVFLSTVTDDGVITRIVSQAPYRIGIHSQNTTYMREIGPQLAVDSMGRLHMVHTYLSGGAFTILNVIYLRFSPEGQKEYETMVTTGYSVQHFPTIHIDKDDNIYVAWEDDRDGHVEGYFSKYDSRFNKIISEQRITWEKRYTKLPQIITDEEGGIHAFYYRSYGTRYQSLRYRNNVTPTPVSIWHRIGIDPYGEGGLLQQFVYFIFVTSIYSIVDIFKNGLLILAILLTLAILNRIGLLYILQQSPYKLMGIVILTLYLLLPAQSFYTVPSILVDNGYYLLAALFVSINTLGLLKWSKLTPSSSMNILIGMVIWCFGYFFISNYPVVVDTFLI